MASAVLTTAPKKESIKCFDEPRELEGRTDCGWDASETFVCQTCGRECCYCQGCILGDLHDEDCDDCWSAADRWWSRWRYESRMEESDRG